ncbi:MAG: RidA family protein [Chloroflexi bacterium]|nr:RidA family protein [Chloroflexota bacterium]
MLEHRNPRTLRQPTGTYSQVVTARGGTTVYVAGQVATDPSGAIVGEGDLGAQAGRVFANLRAALEAAGAAPSHVAKLTIYVVGLRAESRDLVNAELREMFGDRPPANTLLGVESLARPEYLLEIDAVAVLD